jgi:hypothetical protein
MGIERGGIIGGEDRMGDIEVIGITEEGVDITESSHAHGHFLFEIPIQIAMVA